MKTTSVDRRRLCCVLSGAVDN